MKHKAFWIYTFLLIMIAASCDQMKLNKNSKWSGKKEKPKNELVKNYRKDGSLLSTVTYKNGVKNGTARNYYKNGKVQAEFNYKNGLKDGEEKVYYENGKPYTITNYTQARKDGVYKKYYKNGQLCAEVLYDDNVVMPGLKEYYRSGKLKTKTVSIQFELIDQTAFENRFVLKMHLSDGSQVAKFFRIFEDEEGNYIGRSTITSNNGTGEMIFPLGPGKGMIDKIKIWAERTTSLKHPEVIEGTYRLSIQNKKRF